MDIVSCRSINRLICNTKPLYITACSRPKFCVVLKDAILWNERWFAFLIFSHLFNRETHMNKVASEAYIPSVIACCISGPGLFRAIAHYATDHPLWNCRCCKEMRWCFLARTRLSRGACWENKSLTRCSHSNPQRGGVALFLSFVLRHPFYLHAFSSSLLT